MPKASQLLTGEVEEKDYVPFEECQQEGEEEITSDSRPDTQPSDNVEEEQVDSFTLLNEEYNREQEEHRQKVIAAIIEYTQKTMSPFVKDEEELEKLCGYIREWADNPKYTPAAINLKRNLTTLDLRHFIWNIGERIGDKKDYTGNVRALFIQSLFPKEMKDITLDSIRNFKFEPDKGNIKLDPPDKDDYAFHYDK